MAVFPGKVPVIYISNELRNHGATRASDSPVVLRNSTMIPVLDLDESVIPLGSVLKVDVEGDEDFLFTLKPETLKKFGGFMIECHENIRPGIGNAIYQMLQNIGVGVTLNKHGKNVSMIYGINDRRKTAFPVGVGCGPS